MPAKAKAAPRKLYPCCTDTKCKTYQNTVFFLTIWGLGTSVQQDGKGAYFEIAMPDNWQPRRRERFVESLEQLKTRH